MLIHIRYDEISLKGNKRAWFEGILRENIARQLGIPAGKIERTRGRMVVHVEGDDPEEALATLTRCFGVKSAAVVQRVEKTLEAATEVAVALAREAADEGKQTFKIETRRSDKKFHLGSYEVSRELGHSVLEAVPELTVDVHRPECTVRVEVRGDGIYLSANDTPCPGGVPVGTGGRALVLLSGGIDSPVAAWHTLKRGMHTDGVYYHAFPYTGDQVREKVLTIAQLLSRWTPRPLRVMVPSTTKIQDTIAAGAPEPLRVVLLRRSMYRIAAAIAEARGYAALVTGEALGQVASQTPQNLLCVEAVVPRTLVLRPLVGFDKHEIIARAQAIRTFETSILPYQDCCSLFAPKRPATAASLTECEEAEAGLPALPELEAESLAELEVFKCTQGGAPERLGVGLKAWRGRPQEAGPPADPAPPQG